MGKSRQGRRPISGGRTTEQRHPLGEEKEAVNWVDLAGERALPSVFLSVHYLSREHLLSTCHIWQDRNSWQYLTSPNLNCCHKMPNGPEPMDWLGEKWERTLLFSTFFFFFPQFIFFLGKHSETPDKTMMDDVIKDGQQLVLLWWWGKNQDVAEGEQSFCKIWDEVRDN